jgi:uncharacterized membrane protein
MRGMVTQYIIALVVFLAIDAVWLITAGRTFYVAEIGGLLRERPNLVVAFGFYLLFIAGLVYFAIAPAGSLQQAVIGGAFFGLVAYATYDLTNLATLKGFTTRVAIIDMLWGTALSATVCAITFWISRKQMGSG